MNYEFRNRSQIDNAGTKVFSIAYDKMQKRSPVRVEAYRNRVEDDWGIDWRDREAVIERMDVERLAYLRQAEAVALDDYNGMAVFPID